MALGESHNWFWPHFVNSTARRLVLPGDLQGRSRHVDHDDDDGDDDESNWGGRIKSLLKIFNECRSLTGVGELNPYWRIFNECRSLTGMGEFIWDV